MKGCVIIPKHVGFTHTTSDQDDKVEQISFGLSVIFDGRNFDTSYTLLNYDWSDANSVNCSFPYAANFRNCCHPGKSGRSDGDDSWKTRSYGGHDVGQRENSNCR